MSGYLGLILSSQKCDCPTGGTLVLVRCSKVEEFV